MTPTTNVPKSGFVANEPLLVGAFVTWLFSFIGSLILGHTDLITSSQWSGLTTILVPVVSAAIIGAIAWVTRKFVAPAWKVLTDQTHKVGIPDTFLEELALHGVTQSLRDAALKYPELGKVLAAIEANYRNAADTAAPPAQADSPNGQAQAG